MKLSLKFIISIYIILFSLPSFSQTSETLKSQLDYCRKEGAKLEATVETYKSLLEIQGADIQKLKMTQQDQEIQIKNLKSANTKLNDVALELVSVATTYESLGKYQEAIEIYKLLIRNYPDSMEAISSRIKVIDLKKKDAAQTK